MNRIGGLGQPPIDDPIIKPIFPRAPRGGDPTDPGEPSPITPPTPIRQPTPPTRAPLPPNPVPPKPPGGGGPPRYIPHPIQKGPPTNIPPNAPPATAIKGTATGVIQSVDNANTPKFATVLINNNYPARLCIFAQPVGPFAAGGTSGYLYFYNNAGGTGGSWCTVDLNSNLILSVSNQVSLTAPTPFYAAITDHKHSGGPNADGIQDPVPVNLSANESQNNLPYNQNTLAIQGTINNAGQIQNTPFSGTVIDANGQLTKWSGSMQSSTATQTLSAGQQFNLKCRFKLPSTGTNVYFMMGSTTSGYGFRWDSGGVLTFGRWTSGTTWTVLGTFATVAQDTNWHSVEVTAVANTVNSIEVSFDNYTPLNIQSNIITLTGASWPVTVQFPVNTVVLDYSTNVNTTHYYRAPLPIQKTIDVNSNFLNVEFAGGQQQPDGSLTNIHNIASQQSYPLVSGVGFSVSADIAKGVSTAVSGILVGTTTNGYYIQFGNAFMSLVKLVSGTATVIGSNLTSANDTSYHSFRLTITPGSPNTIEGSVDGNYFTTTDSALTLTSANQNVILYTGNSTGLARHVHVSGTTNHHNVAPPSLRNIVDINSQGQQEDYYGLVEASPTNASYAGYKIASGTTERILWDKASVNRTIAQGPIVYEFSHFVTANANNYCGWVFLANASGGSAGTLPTSCYLVQWSGGTVSLFKRASSAWGSALASITVNDHTSYFDQHLKVVVQRDPFGNVVISVFAQGASSPLVYTDTSSAYGSGYDGIYTGNSTLAIKSYSVTQSQAETDIAVAPRPRKNLIVNGNNCSGNATVSPLAFGWTNIWVGGTILSNGTYVVNGKSFPSMQVTGVGGQGAYQVINVTPGQTYTVCTMAYADATAQAAIWVGNTAGTITYQNPTTIPLGKPGVFYQAATRVRAGLNDANNVVTGTTSSAAWECLYATFTVPSNQNTAMILLRNMGSAGTVYFNGVSITEGVYLQEYIDHELNPGGVHLPIHVSGTLPYVNNHAAVTGTLSSSAGADGLYLDSGSVSRRHDAGYIGTGQNLLHNTTGLLNLNDWAIFDSGVGGTRSFAADSSFAGRFQCARSGTTGSGSNGDYLLYQNFTPGSTTTYVVSGYCESSITTLGGGLGAWVDVCTGTGTVINSSPALTSSGSGQVYFMFTVSLTGGTTYQFRFRTQFATGYAFLYRPQIEVGTIATAWQEPISHAVVQFQSDSVGNFRASSAANKNIPSLLSFTTDGILTLVSVAPGTTQKVSIDNGTSGTNCHLYLPDGTNQVALALSRTTFTSVAAGGAYTSTTSGANGISFTGETNGATYYFMASWNNVTQLWTVAISATNTPFTATQQISMYLDGGYLAFAGQSSGVSWTGGGGTGSHNGCPEIHQKLPILRWDTEQVDYAEARTLRVKDFVLDPDGSWNIVYRTGSDPAQIWEVEFDTETIRVDASHLFDVGNGKWANVKNLKPGDILRKYGGGGILVKRISCIGDGMFQHISCYRMRYVLGQTVSHNVKPL